MTRSFAWWRTPIAALALGATVQAQPAVVDPAAVVKQAIDSGNADRTRAALTLMFESGVRGLDKPTITALAKIAATAEPDVKAEIARAIGKGSYATPEAVALLESLADANQPVLVRRAAAAGLSDLAQGTSLEFVLPELSMVNSSKDLQAAVAKAGKDEALADAQARTASVAPLLRKLLGDNDPKVVAAGARAVRGFALAIAAKFNDPKAPLRDSQSPVNLYEGKGKWLLLKPTLERLNLFTPALEPAFQSPDRATRADAVGAAEALIQLRRLAFLNRTAKLDEEKPDPAFTGNEDILKSGLLALLPAMVNQLRSGDADTRLSVLEAMENLDEAAVGELPTLKDATKDSSVFVRWIAVRAASKTVPDDVAVSQTPEVINILVSALPDRDLDVRIAALGGLSRLGKLAQSAGPAVAHTASTGDIEARIAAMRTLEVIQPDFAIVLPTLRLAFVSEDPRLRGNAADLAGTYGPKGLAAAGDLRPLLNDSDPAIRKKAAEALLALTRGR